MLNFLEPGMTLNARTGYTMNNVPKPSQSPAHRPVQQQQNNIQQQRYENTAVISQQTNHMRPSIPANRPVFQQPSQQVYGNVNTGSVRTVPNKLPNGSMPIMGMFTHPNGAPKGIIPSNSNSLRK